MTPMGVMSLQVQLERFSGPLSLLLHLIKEQEMDIFDIDIAKITSQYLEHIKNMKRLDLEVAGDFVAMAATLLQIKSRMLLPSYGEDGEEIVTEDPRKELVNKLLEYQKFQEAADQLRKRTWVGRDLWLRGERVSLDDPNSDDVILEDNPLFSLISSYRKVIRAMKTGVHRVKGAMQSIADRIVEMKERLIIGEKVGFDHLITAEGENRSGQILLTFLSLLELAKMGIVSLFQAENFGLIQIEARREIDNAAVSQVEKYDGVASEQVAAQILADSVTATDVVPAEEPVEVAASDEEIAAEELKLGYEGV